MAGSFNSILLMSKEAKEGTSSDDLREDTLEGRATLRRSQILEEQLKCQRQGSEPATPSLQDTANTSVKLYPCSLQKEDDLCKTSAMNEQPQLSEELEGKNL